MKHNPYIGPRPFERSDRDRFFGRARETRDLLSLIMAERVVLFYAQSGAGKTSLLNTQIVPALEEEGFRVLPVARVGSDAPRGVDSTSSKNIFVFSALLALAGPQSEINQLSSQPLKSFLASIADDERPPIVIFDQFEEILTTHRDRWEDARGFFEQLRDALQAIPKLGVVLAMREDHVAGLDPYAALLPKRLKTRFRMELLGYDGALEAVKKPAQNAGCAYGTGVAERLVDDLRRIQITANSTGSSHGALGPYIEPVQLQVVCSRLWDNLPERDEYLITWPEIEQFGNIDRALTDFYESALQNTTQETSIAERQLRRWFGAELITPMKTRGLALRGEHDTSGLPNEAVDVLDRQHLIRAEARAGTYWYELAHDRLVEPIVNSNMAWEQARMTPLRATAQNWQQRKNADLLYGGHALLEAESWARTHPAEVEDYEREFLEASAQAQRVKARKRIVRLSLMAALSAGLVIMAVLAIFAFESRQEAVQNQQKAEQQQALAVEAQATAVAGQQAAEQQRQIAVTAQAQALDSAAEAEAASVRAETNQRQAEQQSRLARTGQLAAQSQVALDKHAQRSVLLALEALTVTQQAGESLAPAARQALFDALRPISGRGVAVQYKPIMDLALSADGRWLATADEEQNARLWDLHAEEPALHPIVLPGQIDRVTISPDGHWLATSGSDPTAGRLWDLQSAQPVSAPIVLVDQTTPANELIFSPDSRWLATSDNDYVLRLWDLATPNQPRAYETLLRDPAQGVPLVPGERLTLGLSISPDNRWLVSSGGMLDNNLHLWDLAATDPTTRSITVLNAGPTESHFSLDGRWLVTRSGDDFIQRWAMTDVLESRVRPVAMNKPGTGDGFMALSPDSRWLAIGNRSGAVALKSPNDPNSPAKTLLGDASSITSLSFSPDGHWLVSTGFDGASRVWDLTAPDGDLSQVPPRVLRANENTVSASAIDTHEQLVTASWDGTAHLWDLSETIHAQPTILANPGKVTRFAVSGDGRWLATATEDLTITLRDLQTIFTSTAQPLALPPTGATLKILATSSDGHWLATGSTDNLARLYDLRAADPGHSSIELAGHTGEVSNIFFSPDNHWLLTVGTDNTSRLWDLTAADPALSSRMLTQAEWPLTWALFSPNGHWLITFDSFDTNLLWNLQATEPMSAPLDLRAFSDSSPVDAAFSSDSQRLLIGLSDGSAYLWKLSANGLTGQPQVFHQSTEPLHNVAFSQDDRYAIIMHGITGIVDGQSVGSYTGSGASYLWDWQHPDRPPLVLPQSQMASAMLSPDRRWLLIGSDALRLWDLAASDPSVTALTFSNAAVLDSVFSQGQSGAFSPDGHWLIVADGNSLQLWNLNWDELAAQACRSVGRNFTQLEWRQYFPDQPYRKTCNQWPLEDSGQ